MQKGIGFIFLGIPLIGLAGWLGYSLSKKAAEQNVIFNRPTDEAKIRPGCLLITPSVTPYSEEDMVANTKDQVFLINKRGELLKKWQTSWPAFYAKLNAQGEMWAVAGVGAGLLPQARLLKYKWDGTLEKEIPVPGLSHDFDFIDDDRIVTSVYAAPHARQAAQLEKYKSNVSRQWRNDHIIEIDVKSGEVVRRYDMSDIVKLKSLDDFQIEKRDIYHTDSIYYIKHNPWNERDGYLLTVRNISKVIFVDRATGELVWSSPEGMLSYPHAARMLENQDILVFNNAPNKGISTLVQINVRTNEVVWNYESRIEETFLFSAMGGAAQRLDNGNTLVTNSTHGQVLEIASSGEVVLDLFQKFILNPPEAAWPYAWIFRVDQYQTKDFNGKAHGISCE